MDVNNYNTNEIKLLISKLLNNGLTEETNNEVIQYLCNIDLPGSENVLYTLLYLKETTPMIDLFISNFAINKLLLFLNDKDNCNYETKIEKTVNNCDEEPRKKREPSNSAYYTTPSEYEPMTEEKALTIQFDPTDPDLKFPAKGFYSKMFEKFYFRDGKDGSLKHCSREFKVDHEGRVVAYYGETITNDDEEILAYYSGAIGDILFDENAEKKEELTESDLQLD